MDLHTNGIIFNKLNAWTDYDIQHIILIRKRTSHQIYQHIVCNDIFSS